ncbi:Ankyrin-like protein, partial [Daphnia magna]
TENTINEFLGCVSEKLGKDAVKKLVLHKENNELDVVIIYALRKSWADKCIAMFAYLDDEGRDEVRHLVESLPSHTDVERYGHQLKDNWHEVDLSKIKYTHGKNTLLTETPGMGHNVETGHPLVMVG